MSWWEEYNRQKRWPFKLKSDGPYRNYGLEKEETYEDVTLDDIELVRELLLELRGDIVDVSEVDNVELDPLVELVEDTTTGHVSTLTVFVSRVTLAPNANAPPFNTAAVSSVTEAAARILP
jgi:hypothetical protein